MGKASQPPSGCLISGDHGYLYIHYDFIKRVWRGDATSLQPKEAQAKEVRDDPSAYGVDVAELAAAGARLSMKEVGEHRTKQDCWIVIDGMVFNVSAFLS